ncbi:hypothetical protein ACFL56_01830 [Candidatus Margulisiibacteriota bacterium]
MIKKIIFIYSNKKKYYPEDAINVVAEKTNTSFEKLQQELGQDRNSELYKILVKMQKIKTIDNLKNIVPNVSTYNFIKFLPFYYNAIYNRITLYDFLNTIIDTQNFIFSHHVLFRWLPLIEFDMKGNQIQKIFEKMVNNKNINKDKIYTDFSGFSNEWKKYVTRKFLNKFINNSYKKNKDFPIFHFIPWDTIPVKVRHKREKQYIRKTFKTIETTNKIIPVAWQTYMAGTCPACQRYHWQSIMENKYNFGIIKINNEPLFVIKLKDHKSMVALKNYRTEGMDSKIAAMKGGVYVPPQSIVDKFEKVSSKNNNTVKVINVDTITVKPLSWINMVHTKWPQDQFEQYLKKLNEIYKTYH